MDIPPDHLQVYVYLRRDEQVPIPPNPLRSVNRPVPLYLLSDEAAIAEEVERLLCALGLCEYSDALYWTARLLRGRQGYGYGIR